ncbi:hypothetical protein N9J52_00650 [Flavobacteriales bacterium]|nr:hypothetical protein [Flavobacteriales bacterium]
MKKQAIVLLMTVLGIVPAMAQNLNSSNGGYETTREIDGKKFWVDYYEYEVDKTLDEAWAEVAGNFINVGDIHKSINESHCESGDITEGEGASRFCSINFNGKVLELKERITEVKEKENRKEFTYEVYDNKGFPAKVYNTWVVRVGDDGKTYLGNTFILRGNMAFLSGMMMKKLAKLGGLRNAVLGYVHYLETGEKKADPAVFERLYPEPEDVMLNKN